MLRPFFKTLILRYMAILWFLKKRMCNFMVRLEYNSYLVKFWAKIALKCKLFHINWDNSGDYNQETDNINRMVMRILMHFTNKLYFWKKMVVGTTLAPKSLWPQIPTKKFAQSMNLLINRYLKITLTII